MLEKKRDTSEAFSLFLSRLITFAKPATNSTCLSANSGMFSDFGEVLAGAGGAIFLSCDLIDDCCFFRRRKVKRRKTSLSLSLDKKKTCSALLPFPIPIVFTRAIESNKNTNNKETQHKKEGTEF